MNHSKRKRTCEHDATRNASNQETTGTDQGTEKENNRVRLRHDARSDQNERMIYGMTPICKDEENYMKSPVNKSDGTYVRQSDSNGETPLSPVRPS